MLIRTHHAAWILLCAAACSEPPPKPKVKAPPSPAVAPAKPVAPLPPPPPPPVRADSLPPRTLVQGEGITLSEYVDGRVNVKSTTRWNEAIDRTYDDCTYYRAAVPVMKRELPDADAKLLDAMCKPGKKPRTLAKTQKAGAAGAAAKAPRQAPK
jgi:hypothetical protein